MNNRDAAALLIDLSGKLLAEQATRLAKAIKDGTNDGENRDAMLETLKAADLVGTLSTKLTEVAVRTCEAFGPRLARSDNEALALIKLLDDHAAPTIKRLTDIAKGRLEN